MQRVTHVSAMPNYRLHLRFQDESEGVVDLSDHVGKGVFESWKDEANFRMVGIDPQTGAPCWPGGIDLCPDSLYQEVTGRSLINQKSAS